MKDWYSKPDGWQGPGGLFRVTRAQEFFASLPLAPKNSLDGLRVASQVVDGATGNLLAAGTHPYGVAVALTRAVVAIAERESWPQTMREELLGRAALAFAAGHPPPADDPY